MPCLRLPFACLLIGAAICRGDDRVDYARQIKPILKERCFACHGALKQKSGVRLDTAQLIREGRRRRPIVIPGKASGSALIARVSSKDDDERMPPEGKPLTPAQIQLLEAWIDQGAQGPAEEKPEADPREHWAFRRPVRPSVPHVGKGGSISNPIDAFLAAKRAERGLSPLQAAEKSLLLRRTCLDLIGLPPTRAELRAFLEDDRPDAFERVVDRLLASPAHGERWGRHWMDVWRYTDWYGLGKQLRYSQKHVWHWRDWIIESLNDDKGYDQMILEMLAADEIAPTDLGTLRASGFLVRNYFLFNRTTWLDNTIEHTSKAFLGLTMQCAKCHDHKYDPIRQTDYYRFRAIFEPHQVRLDQQPGEIDLEKDGLPRAFDAHPEAPTYLHVRGNEKDPDKSRPLKPGIPELLAFEDLTIHEVALPATSHYPALRSYVLADHLRIAEREIETARTALNAAKGGKIAAKAMEVAELRPDVLRAVHRAESAKHDNATPDVAKELVRQASKIETKWAVAQAELALLQAEETLRKADAKTKAKATQDLNGAQAKLAQAKKRAEKPDGKYQRITASLKAFEGPAETSASRTKPYPKISTGRRTALAKWIIDERNPLTARVAVNHLWLRHFGQPLVESVTDFGRRAPEPTHRDLLDWLAMELMENNWSMKHLHRLMVTSDAYRLSGSTIAADSLTKQRDPGNRYYWHRNPIRMQAQVIRDSLLHLSGQLENRLGGPTIDPKASGTTRRSLYFTRSRDHVHPFLDVFDDANIRECYRRTESIKPQQALTLSNSRLALQSARTLTARMSAELGNVTDEAFVETAFKLILCTAPTSEEKSLCIEALNRTRALLSKRTDARLRARQNLVHALLNHNDFVTIR